MARLLCHPDLPLRQRITEKYQRFVVVPSTFSKQTGATAAIRLTPMTRLTSFLLTAAALCAQETHPTTPHLTGFSLRLNLNVNACLDRASAGLSALGLILHGRAPTAQGGSNERLFAIVACESIPGATSVNIAVAGSPGNRGDTYNTALYLRNHMANPSAGRPTSTPPAPTPPQPTSGAAVDITGTWVDNTEGFGQSRWILKPIGPGRYSATQQGLGNVSGTAVVTGRHVRIDWSSGGWAAFIEYDLDAAGTSGSGILTITQGRTGRYRTTITREGAPSGQPTAVPTATAGPAVNLSGTWVIQSVGMNDPSVWVITPLGGNRYQAQQQDYGRASGVPVVTGSRVQYHWSVAGGLWQGDYDLTFGADGIGRGTMTLTHGDTGTRQVTMRRQ
jgi:hypothetical protein